MKLKLKERLVDLIIFICMFLLSKNYYTRDYILYFIIGFLVIACISVGIDIFLLLNEQKICDVKIRYIQNRIKSLNDIKSEIKNDVLDYIFKRNISCLLMVCVLLFWELLVFRGEVPAIFKIIICLLIIKSIYKIILIFIYDEVPGIYHYISKFIDKRVEKNLNMKEEYFYIISIAEILIVLFIFIISIVGSYYNYDFSSSILGKFMDMIWQVIINLGK